MTTRRVTDRLVHWVEAAGVEVAVTLIVQGTPVVGFLTSVLREREHTRNTVATCQLIGDGLPMYPPDPPTDREREAIREAWRAEHPEWDETADVTFDSLCLRNAVIRSGPPESWTECHYLVIEADHVSAISVGILTPPPVDDA